jgi:hypothetical protein
MAARIVSHGAGISGVSLMKPLTVSRSGSYGGNLVVRRLDLKNSRGRLQNAGCS